MFLFRIQSSTLNIFLNIFFPIFFFIFLIWSEVAVRAVLSGSLGTMTFWILTRENSSNFYGGLFWFYEYQFIFEKHLDSLCSVAQKLIRVFSFYVCMHLILFCNEFLPIFVHFHFSFLQTRCHLPVYYKGFDKAFET